MNVQGISDRADSANGFRDEGRDMSRTGDGAACEDRGADNAVQGLVIERTSGSTGMQKVDDYIAEIVREYGSSYDDSMRRAVGEAERKFGCSEHVVLVKLYLIHDKYDRIRAVIEELDKEELLAVARVLIEELYIQELYDQGPYGCRTSWYCRCGVRRVSTG